MVIGGNPVYDAPADLKFSEKIANQLVPIRSVWVTTKTKPRRACQWHLPMCHSVGNLGRRGELRGPAERGPAADRIRFMSRGRHCRLIGRNWRASPTGQPQVLVREAMSGCGSIGTQRRRLGHNCCTTGFVDSSVLTVANPSLSGDRRRVALRYADAMPSSWSWYSHPRPAPTTAGSPTTAGCKRHPTLSLRSPGTTWRS